MKLRKVYEQVIHHSICFLFDEVRIRQATVLQPTDDDHAPPVLEYTEGLRVLFPALNLIADVLQVFLQILPDGAALG